MAEPKGALGGGHAESHPGEVVQPLLVGPSTTGEFNTLRFGLIPLACWRLNDVRFDFDSSFVLPESKEEFAELAVLREKHKGAPLTIFGHADPTGDDNYNKALSGRRAEAIYAVLVREPERWEKIRSAETGGHQWDTRSIQLMLKAVGEDPGDATGTMNPKTLAAIKSFQGKNGLTPDGDPGKNTRAKLFPAYMDFLAGSLKLTSADFLAQGADPGGKGDFQGCGEFNPTLVFSKAETTEFQKPSKKAERDEQNSPNRRVMILLFKPGSKVPPGKWPCPKASDGVAGCKARFWSDGDTRRNPKDARREFAATKDTFGCRFYHRLTVSSPCEGVGPITPQTLYLKLSFVDDHFAPNQEKCVIKYTILGFAGKPVKLEIYSKYCDGGSPLFSKELTDDEKTDGDHTFEWDGKALAGSLKDHFIHPLFSPYKVHLFHEGTWTSELETKVLYHSIELKKGPQTPDEKEPAKGTNDWVQFKLNELGYIGGPVGKDTDDYLKKAVIRYKANHKKFRKPFIGDYDGTVPADLVTALAAKENDRKHPDLGPAIESSGAKANLMVELLTYERTGASSDEFGSPRINFEPGRLNRPIIPVEALIYIKKKDDSKVLEPEAVGPCRIDWTFKDADEDLAQQPANTATEPSKTKKYVEQALKQESGRTGTNGDNCPEKFGGIRKAPADNWKTPFFAGDVYIPYDLKEDSGHKVMFSTACVDKAKFPKRFGRAGAMMRTSYVSGDDYQFRAEISFFDMPNKTELEQFHKMTADVATHMGADTGKFTVRRFAKVLMSIDWPARTNDYQWPKISSEFQQSFIDMDTAGITTKKMSQVITLQQYRDLVTANTSHTDPAKISLHDDAMVGVALPAQGNQNAGDYKKALTAFAHKQYNSKIQGPLGQLLSNNIRKDHPTGFIICNFLLHKPVNIKTDPKNGNNAVTGANTNYITWGGSIGLADSVILLDQKDPDHVYYVVSHEMGHNLYLLHWENTGETNLANHDQNDHNCTMSYSTNPPAFQAQGVYSPHFCGKCTLAMRGWDITNSAMLAQST